MHIPIKVRIDRLHLLLMVQLVLKLDASFVEVGRFWAPDSRVATLTEEDVTEQTPANLLSFNHVRLSRRLKLIDRAYLYSSLLGLLELHTRLLQNVSEVRLADLIWHVISRSICQPWGLQRLCFSFLNF